VFSACLVSGLVLLWWRLDRLFIRCVVVGRINFLALEGPVIPSAVSVVVAFVFCLLYEGWCLRVERVRALVDSVLAFLAAVSTNEPGWGRGVKKLFGVAPGTSVVVSVIVVVVVATALVALMTLLTSVVRFVLCDQRIGRLKLVSVFLGGIRGEMSGNRCADKHAKLRPRNLFEARADCVEMKHECLCCCKEFL
jgi:hypothetical protein